ncbi:hypothetical protein E9993_20555 [Labilibacter sediminis]|nr:hypothetical protein E9993_20555 [Labilibacter sediminis]
MKQTISILGCGWLGLPLAGNLREKGYALKGSTTSNDKLEVLKQQGIKPYLIQLSDLKSNISDFLNSDILIIATTSKSIQDYKKLIYHIEKSSIKRVLFVSSTSVYESLNQTVTEETPVMDVSLVRIESLFHLNSYFKTTILRFGGLFGYSRKPANFFIGKKAVDQPDGFVNLIHRDDCIGIMIQLIDQEIWGEIFNACADTHPTRREFYTKEMVNMGYNLPVFKEGVPKVFKIVSNAKIKQRLVYRFKFSDLMSLFTYD